MPTCSHAPLSFPDPYLTLGLKPPLRTPTNSDDSPGFSLPSTPYTYHNVRAAVRAQLVCWHPDKSLRMGLSTKFMENMARRILWAGKALELDLLAREAGFVGNDSVKWRREHRHLLPSPSLVQIMTDELNENAAMLVEVSRKGRKRRMLDAPAEFAASVYSTIPPVRTVDDSFFWKMFAAKLVDDLLPKRENGFYSWRVWEWLRCDRFWLSIGKLEDKAKKEREEHERRRYQFMADQQGSGDGDVDEWFDWVDDDYEWGTF
jgi:hypothetical protein